jgi:hypothetical protein
LVFRSSVWPPPPKSWQHGSPKKLGTGKQFGFVAFLVSSNVVDASFVLS